MTPGRKDPNVRPSLIFKESRSVKSLYIPARRKKGDLLDTVTHETVDGQNYKKSSKILLILRKYYEYKLELQSARTHGPFDQCVHAHRSPSLAALTCILFGHQHVNEHDVKKCFRPTHKKMGLSAKNRIAHHQHRVESETQSCKLSRREL